VMKHVLVFMRLNKSFDPFAFQLALIHKVSLTLLLLVQLLLQNQTVSKTVFLQLTDNSVHSCPVIVIGDLLLLSVQSPTVSLLPHSVTQILHTELLHFPIIQSRRIFPSFNALNKIRIPKSARVYNRVWMEDGLFMRWLIWTVLT
jgi:hypothetical protein